MPCSHCFPWNLPLTLSARQTVEGAVVPLVYEQWLAFHYHVLQHQSGRWAGEIDSYTKQLQTSESVLS